MTPALASEADLQKGDPDSGEDNSLVLNTVGGGGEVGGDNDIHHKRKAFVQISIPSLHAIVFFVAVYSLSPT